MKYPKISVITPSFNQGKFIEETILSVINQNYPNLEYIIIDGGSTDNSIEIIEKYKDHLAYWVSEKDNGQSAAINKGLALATGDILCWLNSDDIFMPNALEYVALSFTKDNTLEFLNGNTVIIDKNSNIMTCFFTLKQKKWYAKYGVYYVNQPSMFWKKVVTDKLGFLNEEYHAAMDREFLLRIFENGFKIGQTKKILSGFRVHALSKSAGNSTEWRLRDKDELTKLYDGRYSQDPHIIYKIIYRLEKFFKGVYFQKWVFLSEWKGKNVKEYYVR